jgi:hypothetical protein
VRFSGQHLFVNVDAAQGELRAEVLDRDGNVLEPFSRARCRPVTANQTLQAITWDGAADLAKLAGREVRFRFHLTDGKLYSFWVAPTPAGASHGYVLGGGPGFTSHADTVGKAAYAKNHTPFANAGADQSVRDVDGDGHQVVSLDAGNSSDVDGKITSFNWLIEETPIANGQRVDVKLPVGKHTVTLAARDDAGASGFDQLVVHVQPKTDPVIPPDRLVMWLKADAITAVGDGDRVAKWDDASPSGLFSFQEEPTKQPLWIRQAINGMPALRFDGKDDLLVVDYCSGLLYSYANSTLIAVVRTQDGGAIISHGHTNMAVNSTRAGSLFYSSSFRDFPSDQQIWPVVGTTAEAAVPLGQANILTMRRSHPDAGGTALLVNGKRDDDQTPMKYHPMSGDNGYVGAAYPGTRNFWNGEIAEIILYGKALSDQELDSVQRYLQRKYKIAAQP